MITINSNLTGLTTSQEEECYKLVRAQFEKLYTEDYWHFSYEGNRYDINKHNCQVVFEIHSEEGSFNGMINLNSKNNPIKSSIRFLKY